MLLICLPRLHHCGRTTSLMNIKHKSHVKYGKNDCHHCNDSQFQNSILAKGNESHPVYMYTP